MTNAIAVLRQAFQDAADALGQVESNVDSVAALIGNNGHARKPPIRRIKGKKIVTVKAYRRSPVVKAVQTHRPSKKAPWAKKRKLKLSAKRVAELKTHGRYVGLMKTLPPKQKKSVQNARDRKGYEAAIALARAHHAELDNKKPA